MDSYRVELAKSALKDLRGIDRLWIPKLLAVIEQLAVDPLPLGCKKLVGSEQTFRVRVGDYRIIYDVHRNKLLIHVIRVRHRRDAYRG